MKVLARLEEALIPLEGQKDKDLVLVLEDWDEGLQVRQGISGEEAQKVLKDACAKYGPRFAFRVFNPQLDVWWNGEAGIIHDEPLEGESIKLFLEPHWRRYPGMQRFGRVLCPGDERPNLRLFCVKAIKVVTEQGVLLRFIGLGSTGGE